MDFNAIKNLLSEEYEYAKENFVPIIRDKSAEYLYNFVKKYKFKSVLEIGTAIGYSGSIILSAGVQSLTTIDINEKSLEVARKTFQKVGFGNLVNIIHNDAKIAIADLVKIGKKFDMIFLDGAKGQYVNYLDGLLQLIREGGVIFADNVLLQGLVESDEKIPHRKRTMVVNLRKYLDRVNTFPLQTELVRIEDGIAITRYKGE